MRKISLIVLAFCGVCGALAAQEDLAQSSAAFSALDGWRLSALYAPARSSAPVAVLLHSFGGRKEDWKQFTPYLAKEGYGYLALDFRGHGASVTDVSGSTASYKNFRRTGTDNEFNQMVRDAEAAIKYLADQGVSEDRIIIIGAGLGANIAVKTAVLHPAMPMIALLTPSLNANRDVLSVNPMRVYGKRPIFIAASPQNAKIFKEANILRNIAVITAGARRVTFVVADKESGTKMLNDSLMRQLAQWIKTPERPDEVVASTSTIVSTEAAQAVDASTETDIGVAE